MDSKQWDEGYETNPVQTVVPDAFFETQIATLTPGTAVDLGCGSGGNAIALAEKGWTVLGLDFSEKAIELARKAASEKNLTNVDFQVVDCTSWKPDEQFDLVTSSFALPNKELGRKVIAAGLAALAPNGTMLVSEWDASMLPVWTMFTEEDLFTVDDLVECLPGLVIESKSVRVYDNPQNFRHNAKVAFVRAKKLDQWRLLTRRQHFRSNPPKGRYLSRFGGLQRTLPLRSV
ncbi:hypothetical protein BSKO_05537 [Bryopsis sp. KO-2023]|nr:hypothetical protein BSKO_05537 [Bryopsis sp. KO-2023]